MELPIFRCLHYISYSTYRTWQKCQQKVYLSKLSGLKYPPALMGLPTQVGMAFDAFVKDYIAQKRNIKAVSLQLDYLLQQVTEKEAIDYGRWLASIYIKLPFIERLMKATEIHLDQELMRVLGGVPILGRLDAIINRELPLDWKVRGYHSKGLIYPHSGYGLRIDYEIATNTWSIKSPDQAQEIPLDVRNPDWATQMLMYGWLVSSYPWVGVIHEVCIQPDKIIFVEHHAGVTKNFAEKVKTNIFNMWNDITDKMYTAYIAEPQPHVRICEEFGNLCEVAQFCKKYCDTLGNPERREFYV